MGGGVLIFTSTAMMGMVIIALNSLFFAKSRAATFLDYRSLCRARPSLSGSVRFGLGGCYFVFGDRHDGLIVHPVFNVGAAIKTGPANLEVARATAKVPPRRECRRLDTNDDCGLFLR